MSAARGPVLIMAGGTGGHVFPALAVAQELRARGIEVCWLGTRRGLEAEVVPAAGLPIEFITVSGLRGKGLTTLLAAPWRLARAVAEALAVLRRLRPVAVLGLGGFASGPGGLASAVLGRPLVIHEQNAVAGMTNRYLARLATRALEAFPGTFPAATRAICTGNPVRPEIAALPEPAVRFAAREGERLRLLVLGGSLGAQALNERVPQALARLQASERPVVRHQCGKQHVEAARAAYQAAGVEAEVMPFIADMAAAYAWADLVICRAGALTIAELAAAGVGAILVPFPHAVDDHQTRNAHFLASRGAAALMPQAALTAESLAARLHELCAQGRPALLEMARTARALARPEATRVVADYCLEVARG